MKIKAELKSAHGHARTHIDAHAGRAGRKRNAENKTSKARRGRVGGYKPVKHFGNGDNES